MGFQMNCKKCYKRLFESDTHCPDCGEAVQPEPKSMPWGLLFVIFALVLFFLLTLKKF
jgi:RNA polymerase subunit RPABC4/transcription elongation factor Spt4